MKLRTIVIAEAGVNHNGSMELARQLIDTASEAGADYVKFQSFQASSLVSRQAPKADYQNKTTRSDESQYDMIKRLELSYDDHVTIIDYCKERDIGFLSSPFDLESITLLDKLGLNTIKVPSGDITNLPYLRKLGRLNKRVFLSTGMANLDEVDHAVRILLQSGTAKEKITVLHCNTEYPTPFEDVNLRAMITIQDRLGIKVGYSDHTPGIEIPIAAVALGGEVIEKHFTLDRNMNGPDHKASLEPHELMNMVSAIRRIELAMGDGVKKPSSSEIRNIPIVRKSLVAAKPVKKGVLFTESNIGIKRPGGGISPMRWDDVIGTPAVRDFQTDEMIEL